MSTPPPRAVTKAISTPTWMADMQALDDRPLKDIESHPWNVGLDWRDGQPIAWVAHKSPNGPDTLFLKHKL